MGARPTGMGGEGAPEEDGVAGDGGLVDEGEAEDLVRIERRLRGSVVKRVRHGSAGGRGARQGEKLASDAP